MKKVRTALVLLALCTLASTTSISAGGLIRLADYYDSMALTNQVGWVYRNCNGTISSSGGVTSNYRTYETENCDTAENSGVACQYWNGSQWVNYTCPWIAGGGN